MYWTRLLGVMVTVAAVVAAPAATAEHVPASASARTTLAAITSASPVEPDPTPSPASTGEPAAGDQPVAAPPGATTAGQDAGALESSAEEKVRAAAVVGIVAPDSWLVLSDRDFVYAIYTQATGPRVKQAALEAFGGTAVQQAEFITSGIDVAHGQDQQDRIDADEQASEAEKERLRIRDAKARAAAVLGIVASEEILTLADDNFVRLILDRAVAGSEVSAAALAALRSTDPTVRSAFIATGIHAANQRDIDNELRRRTAEERRLVSEIQQKAENGRLRLRLATAAGTALASSDAAVSQFLRVGQYNHRMQSLRATTARSSAWYANGAHQSRLTAAPAGSLNAAFIIADGFADPSCFTLESVSFPGWLLTRRGTDVHLVRSDGTAAFRGDATWRLIHSLGRATSGYLNAGGGLLADRVMVPDNTQQQVGRQECTIPPGFIAARSRSSAS